MQILTGDIGGTHTRLALGSLREARIRVEQRQSFPSPAYGSLSEIVRLYLPLRQQAVSIGAFGVAGPVRNGCSRITNLPWEICAQSLRGDLQLGAVYLLNDLEALAWGIGSLGADELVCLHEGAADASGNRAVIAAGTGLGQAGLYADGDIWRPFATEGGHTDFAAQDEREWRLAQYLQARYGHLSWERVLSGPGVVTLFEFLLHEHKAATPDWFADPTLDPGARITELGLQQADALCVETLQWFVRLYGREAGNLALKMKATGGVYLGGGIAPEILPALRDGAFVEAFLGKGRMRPLLESTPVQVINNSDLTALMGLTRYALTQSAVADPT